MSTDDGPAHLAQHLKDGGAQAVIVVDGSADPVITLLLDAGWTWAEQVEMHCSGKRIRYLRPPQPESEDADMAAYHATLPGHTERITFRHAAAQHVTFAPDMFAPEIGKRIPLLRSPRRVCYGVLVAAEVIEDGRAVTLTVECDPEIARQLRTDSGFRSITDVRDA